MKIFEVMFFFSSSPRYVSTAERNKGCDLNVDAAELLSSLSWQAWKFEIHCLRCMPLVRSILMITYNYTMCLVHRAYDTQICNNDILYIYIYVIHICIYALCVYVYIYAYAHNLTFLFIHLYDSTF